MDVESKAKRLAQAVRLLPDFENVRVQDPYNLMGAANTDGIRQVGMDFLDQLGISVSGSDEVQQVISETSLILGVRPADLLHSIWLYLSGEPVKRVSEADLAGNAEDPSHHTTEATSASRTVVFRSNVHYIRWINDHPDGYVLNRERNDPTDQVLHRATCGRIRMPDRNWVESSSEKVGSLQVEALIAYGIAKAHERPRRCVCLK